MADYERNQLLGFHEIMDVMKYLGYHDTPQTQATATALAGKLLYNINCPSVIATEYARHSNLALPSENQPF